LEPLLVLGGFAVFILAAWYFGHDQVVERRLAAVPVTPIGQVNGGQVRVVGRVHAVGECLLAPGSGRPCLAYSVHVTDHGKKNESIARFHLSTRFWIEDATGRARIEAGPNVEIVMLGKPPMNGLVYRTQLVDMLLARGIDRLTVWGNDRDFHFEEKMIAEGNEVSVMGFATVEVDPSVPAPGPRELPTSTVLRGGADGPLLIGGSSARG
jgi:hypothetical protein